MSDIYVVVHIATTCDESTTYVTKDSTELIEFAWSVVDAITLENSYQDSILVRPVNTPITPYCSQLHKISWEHVRNAGTFKDAIIKFDNYVQENIIRKNKEFSFVTLDVGKLRVQLPREARDKSVVLPPYLQHPRVFDLQNEYTKWQASHPEALSYTASSLSNIITALEVEVDNSDQIPTPSSSSSTPPPGSSSSSTTSFVSEPSTYQNSSSSNLNLSLNQETKTRATVNLYCKMLVQLVKKSLPLGEHANVLTKPYDSAQDVRIFLAERSKILYLSNLPTDTTQSELESWFTQYGGRPIAFWTLKNLDTNPNDKNNLSGGSGGNNGNSTNNNKSSKGISGFAVFATHEEATESLSMNGRVLNDRAIEVQASSTRVLDKASDLLTPFPPSKNRPRPGDWTCPSCGFSNFQRRTACFRCSFPATSAVTIQESMFSSNSLNSRRNNNLNGNTNQSQSNASDKLGLNAAVVNAAAAVLNSNQSYNNNFQDHQSPYANHANGGGNISHQYSPQHHQHYNHNHNNNNNSRSHYGNNVPFRAGDWKCSNEVCQYHNFAKNLCCLKCGNAKSATTNSHQNNNTIHSVNSTAAAIAAATASGQPLNLSNGFIGLQQPQPHHPHHFSQSSAPNHQPRHNSNNSNTSNNSHYSNNKPSQMQLHFSQQNNHSNLRGSTTGTPQPQAQLLPQHLMLLQQQHQQHQQQSQSNNQNAQQKYSQSVTNSPGLYSSYGLQQSLNPTYPNRNVPHPPHSAPVMTNGDSTNSTNSTNSNLQNFNPAFNVLTNQINSLSLNNH